ncbi:MAG TPA: PEP-CTERM sorting domain-containing protein [Candidatus Paceibacterota bacterium]|nr:PEP-CTERM sorting domain-containing protein [Candidatus Paceibacterota bacterium]
MKFKNLAVITSILSLTAAANALDISGQFVNIDFDSGGTSNPFKGFDAPSAPEIIGWKNLNNAASLADSGVEGSGAWWGTYQNNSAFMKTGDGAYNLSSYTIQAGDVFDIGVWAKDWATWDSTTPHLTVTLFYGPDSSQNLIGSFDTGTIAKGTWTLYQGNAITASPGSVGQTLGISVLSSGPSGYACFDSTTVNVTSVPEPATLSLVAVAGLGMALMRRKNR